MYTTCPKCDADLRGEEISPEHRKYYGDKTHYSRLIGIEIAGEYDGVLFWRCPDCGWAWQRHEGRLADKAQPHIDKNNQAVSDA